MGYYKNLVIEVCEMYEDGASEDIIHKLTGLSYEEIEEILDAYYPELHDVSDWEAEEDFAAHGHDR